MATVSAAWAVSAGFVALAVASVLGYMGFHFIPTWIAVAVFVVLLTFGVAALIRSSPL